MEDFHFLRPWWLAALIPLIGVMVWSWRRGWHQGTWRAVCDAHLLPHILDGEAGVARRGWWWVVCLCAALAILALAGPAWRQLPQPVFREQSALVVALDLSRSMDAQDVQPSRLVRSRLKLLDLLRHRRDGQTALVAYAGDAFAVTPLTDDTETIAALVPSLTTEIMPAQGSRADLAVELAGRLFAQAGPLRGHVVLFTDGDQSPDLNSAVTALRRAGHTLSVIGVGSADGSPIPTRDDGFVKDQDGQIVVARLNDAGLRELAAAGGGGYTRLRVDDRDLLAALRPLEDRLGRDTSATALQTDRWREEGPWLLLLVLPLAAWGFRRGHLGWAVLCIMPWSPAADAWDWRELWWTPDQLGARSMSHGDYASAMQHFRDPQWRAGAAYRAQEYGDAVDALRELDTPTSHYNRGNALARLGRVGEAIAAYQRTLEQVPDHEDARHNLELLRRLEEAQQPEGEQGDQGEQGDGQQGNSRQQAGGGEPGEPDPLQPGEHQSEGEPQGTASGEAQQSSDAAQSDDPTSEMGPSRPERAVAESDDNSDPGAGPVAGEVEGERDEQRQATDQWLRRIPDDPGGLLRRKFKYQYGRRDRGRASTVPGW